MSPLTLLWFSLASILCFVSLAAADAMIPVLPATSPAQLVFPVVVAVEGICLKLLCGLPLARSLWIAFLMNLGSTVVGELVNAGATPIVGHDVWAFWTAGSVAAGVAVITFFFAISFFVEWLIARRMFARDGRNDAARAVLVANVITYLGIASVILGPPA
ncbi:MAG: hypothetical protein IT290_10910 [Deltaproteobacteria bacterium]|nr:hypothetical protein [Deltaproteobacteria bacterium]